MVLDLLNEGHQSNFIFLTSSDSVLVRCRNELTWTESSTTGELNELNNYK